MGLVSFVTFSMIMTSLMTGQMERASQRLASRLSSFASQNLGLLTKQERETVLVVTNQIQDLTLFARPLDLYSVNRSFVLTQFGLITTYTVILLQINLV